MLTSLPVFAADKAVDKGAAAVADLGEKVTHVLEKADLGELLPGSFNPEYME